MASWSLELRFGSVLCRPYRRYCPRHGAAGSTGVGEIENSTSLVRLADLSAMPPRAGRVPARPSALVRSSPLTGPLRTAREDHGVLDLPNESGRQGGATGRRDPFGGSDDEEDDGEAEDDLVRLWAAEGVHPETGPSPDPDPLLEATTDQPAEDDAGSDGRTEGTELVHVGVEDFVRGAQGLAYHAGEDRCVC